MKRKLGEFFRVLFLVFVVSAVFVWEAQPLPSSTPPDNYLYWANIEWSHISRLSLDGLLVEPIFIPVPESPMGLAVDEEFIYWTYPWGSSIGRAKLNGSESNPYFITGCFRPFGVAVDDNYIYWTNIEDPSGGDNENANKIGRAKLDGSDVNQRFITLSPGLGVRGIAVSKEFIYLAGGRDWHPAIMRANLDGTGFNEAWIEGWMTKPIGSAHCIAITKSHIYWTNYDGYPVSDFPFISRANLDGSNAVILVQGDAGWHSLVGIGTRGDFIYWGEYGGNRIGRSNLDGSNVNPNWITGTGFCGGIALTPQSVKYTFEGFFSPVDNIPTVNKANAGQAIPVKWRLTDKNGLPVSDPASFISIESYVVNCANFEGDPTNTVYEPAAGSSGLQYLGDGRWQFNWKTSKSYKGQCRTMKLTLDDHEEYTASFSFK